MKVKTLLLLALSFTLLLLNTVILSTCCDFTPSPLISCHGRDYRLVVWKFSVYELYEVAVPRKFKFHCSSIVSRHSD